MLFCDFNFDLLSACRIAELTLKLYKGSLHGEVGVRSFQVKMVIMKLFHLSLSHFGDKVQFVFQYF